MKISIVIPTFNRSAKLERLVKTYAKWKKIPTIHILDCSYGDHLEANKALAKFYSNIEYFHYQDECPLPERLLDWLEKSSSPEIFLMGNDEDLFFEEYANYSFKYLLENKNVSTLIGSYITILKPLFRIIPQVSLRKNIPTPFSIKGYFSEKIFTHFLLNSSVKFPPLFYGIRRKTQLLEYYNNLRNFDFKNTTMELADQIYLLKAGNIRCENMFMCFRDESRMRYVREASREDPLTYMPKDEIKLLFKSIFGEENSIYLPFVATYHPAIELVNKKILPTDFLSIYQDSFDIKIFSMNRLKRLFYNFASRIIYKTAFFLNFILTLLLISKNHYKFYFFINLILNPLPVNKLNSNNRK